MRRFQELEELYRLLSRHTGRRNCAIDRQARLLALERSIQDEMMDSLYIDLGGGG